MLQSSSLLHEETPEDPPERPVTMLDTLPEANPAALLRYQLQQQQQQQQQPELVFSQEAMDAELVYARAAALLGCNPCKLDCDMMRTWRCTTETGQTWGRT